MSRSRTAVTFGVQAVTSLSLLLQVRLIKQVLDAVLAVEDREASIRGAVLPIALLARLTATTIAATVAALHPGVLGDLVSRAVWRRMLDVSQSVDSSS